MGKVSGVRDAIPAQYRTPAGAGKTKARQCLAQMAPKELDDRAKKEEDAAVRTEPVCRRIPVIPNTAQKAAFAPPHADGRTEQLFLRKDGIYAYDKRRNGSGRQPGIP